MIKKIEAGEMDDYELHVYARLILGPETIHVSETGTKAYILSFSTGMIRLEGEELNKKSENDIYDMIIEDLMNRRW